MNCRRLQDELFEYLDGELSHRAQAAARRHLEQCEPCRQIVQDTLRTSQALSAHFRRGAESLALDPYLQTRIVASVEKNSTPHGGLPLIPGFWRSSVLLGGGFVLLLTLMLIPRMRQTGASRSSTGNSGPVISLQISSCDPTLTFRFDGTYVIDSLTCQPRTVEESLQLFR